MIVHGTVFETLGKSWKKIPRDVVQGYYLILPSGDRRWIGLDTAQAARRLDFMCNTYLSERDGWQYWIDYCYGYDVDGRLAWANLDQTDRFI